MEIRPLRAELWADRADPAHPGHCWSSAWGGETGRLRLGPCELTVEVGEPSSMAAWASSSARAEATRRSPTDESRAGPSRLIAWELTNAESAAVRVRAVRLVFQVEHAGPLRMFRHGFQSWSPCGVAVVGRDLDPSTVGYVPSLLRGMHHADQEPAGEEELRSELVTLLADGSGGIWCLGFLGGSRHDGTFRVTATEEGPELAVEAHLGGALLRPSVARTLHDVVSWVGGDHHDMLVAWCDALAAAEGVTSPRKPLPVGWCSWYQYFHDIDEQKILSNLAAAADWPFDIFQVDDGYQRQIGEWTVTSERFPRGLGELAGRIERAGMVPGLWIAPFLVSPEAEAARRAGWVAMHETGGELVGMVNPGWGGRALALDVTNPEVREHLATQVRELVEMGWRYLKLDFTYAPSLRGLWSDPEMTPAERVRIGFETVREAAGDDVFLLGCGAPLGAALGLVDGMRIGPDVAPHWEVVSPMFPSYAEVEPAVLNAWSATLARSFTHRRLWISDPDCLLLRTTDTDLSAEAVEAWAKAVAASGGAVFVSDDLSLLGAAERRLFERVVEIAREVDRNALTSPPRCDDLLESDPPRRLSSPVCELLGDPYAATATATCWDPPLGG
ncbi:MAG: hypothetical protein KatS3mg008_1274 [Acidimicrobiales bacterium]|nr:MAG: hypothetical protein KatS3mg008_1274 [Acidimicrobiales bacterium]